MQNKGYVHLYTGNGKGKTTAALGLALRAAGAGKKVYIAQFVKGMYYSELEAIKQIKNIETHQFGLECFIVNTPQKDDIEIAQKGLKAVEQILINGQHEMVILDEACIALYYNLFSFNELISVLNKRNPNTEIVLTGRKAPKELIDFADLVTEMKEIKHYYQKGVQARKGIEN
ncbi:MAG: cob(I)yrinic acid a,c-diamide adenosyltransferase [Bacteroidales bacterium]|nr:cob(I)yrinic acid a,c-diamide adenosyltransferase [Bacteroidales bacterium]